LLFIFNYPISGSFMGFESDSDSEQERDLAKVNLRKRPVPNADNYDDNLLDGFPLWLDRLFEGSTQRYYINYWPEFPALDSNLGARHHMHAE
jgi:DnaJ family protein C protein 16